MLTEEALTPASAEVLRRVLAAEPAWSDPPLLLLTESRYIAPTGAGAVLLTAGNLAVVERSARALTLVTAVRAALRARDRQYQVRDLLTSERAARAEAEAANRVKDEFLGNVSHELRTPLSAILIWARLLTDGKLPPDQHARAPAFIERSAVELNRLVGDLLDVTRLGAGGMRLDWRACDAAAAARSAPGPAGGRGEGGAVGGGASAVRRRPGRPAAAPTSGR